MKRMVKLFQNNGQPIVRGLRIERNAPCPCGSGKKWKKCRMQSSDCQICKTCGGVKTLYENNKTGELFFKCKPCEVDKHA